MVFGLQKNSVILNTGKHVLPGLIFFGLSSLLSAQELSVLITNDEGEALSDAVVELLLPVELAANYRTPLAHMVDQIDKEFVPHITTIVAGSEINFPNSDSILHHVYSFSPARTFNIPLYGRGENHDYFESFPTAGIVEIGCNIHDWMLAYIYVGESELMAISGDDGKAVLSKLPSGSFQLRIWHSRLAEPGNVMLSDVTIASGESQTLSFQVSLQRDRRIRRAPSASRTRYK